MISDFFVLFIYASCIYSHASKCNDGIPSQWLDETQRKAAFIITANMVDERTGSIHDYNINGLYGNRMICAAALEGSGNVLQGQELGLL